MVTSACAAPLIVDFGGFVALMPRNEPPFTCVHSHAGAQKSSGVFFSDTDGEWCRKCPSGRRNAEGVPGGAGKNSYVKSDWLAWSSLSL